MSGIQMILTIGAMILLGSVIIMVNSNILTTEDVLYDSNFGILATSIGSSIIEEANKKYYDDLTDTVVVTNKTNLFTAPSDLGIESGEDPNDILTWDDFDDFNGYSYVDSTMPSAVFNVECEVVYISPSDLNSKSNSREWSKKIIVKVSSESMKDTIVQTSIFSYWWYL
jgi:hypothetical protein